jgi:16S rRNA (guanine966-N2)-methyltransferase
MARRVTVPKPAARSRLRVIAGALRGRRLAAPPGDAVRPTKDVVKEAVFSALDARGAIRDATVLDLYAGTGSLAIEALSRGARRAVLVEHGRAALAALTQNVAQLDLDARTAVVRLDVDRFLASQPPGEAPFDLVLADPPYDLTDDAVSAVVRSLGAPGWLADGAVVAIERPVRATVAVPDGFRACWERTFGDTLVFFVDAAKPPS